MKDKGHKKMCILYIDTMPGSIIPMNILQIIHLTTVQEIRANIT